MPNPVLLFLPLHVRLHYSCTYSQSCSTSHFHHRYNFSHKAETESESSLSYPYLAPILSPIPACSGLGIREASAPQPSGNCPPSETAVLGLETFKQKSINASSQPFEHPSPNRLISSTMATRVALVTASSAGLGAAIVKALSPHFRCVVNYYSRPEKAAAVISEASAIPAQYSDSGDRFHSIQGTLLLSYLLAALCEAHPFISVARKTVGFYPYHLIPAFLST
jgi:hypothetical protein